MSSKEQVDRDIREYLTLAENMSNEGKRTHLRALFDKHFTLTQIEHLIIKSDLFQIVSDSKREYTNLRSNTEISGKMVERSDLTHIAVIEAFVGYLNRNSLLKKLVKFDYTDPSSQYEIIE